MTIGEAIKAARKARGLKQIELAEKAGISVNTIRFWETDRTSPTAIFLCCVADVLDVTLDELVGRKVTK